MNIKVTVFTVTQKLYYTAVGIRKLRTIFANILPFKEQYKVTHINSFTSGMVCKSLQACRYIIPVDFRAEIRQMPVIQVMKVNLFVFGKPLNTYFSANSEDPDEMQHNAAFHQGLHCL